MTEKFDYDSRTYVGATAEDCKVIHRIPISDLKVYKNSSKGVECMHLCAGFLSTLLSEIGITLFEGKKLTIDRDGRVHDDTGRWIADGKERKNGI